MKKVLLTLLAVVLVLVALGAAGMVGYRYGYLQGISSASNSDTDSVVPRFGVNPHGMPMHNFGFERGFGRGDFGMMGRGGMGFGFFGPLMFLTRIAFWALVIWAVYMLITRNGWRITKTQPAPVVSQAPAEVSAEPADENRES
jgi:preprotein translocase subunit SecG